MHIYIYTYIHIHIIYGKLFNSWAPQFSNRATGYPAATPGDKHPGADDWCTPAALQRTGPSKPPVGPEIHGGRFVCDLCMNKC